MLKGKLLLWSWVRCSASAVCKVVVMLMTGFISTDVTWVRICYLAEAAVID